ncbi:hypothetical protein CHELA40_14586 [Chelatococcus asaccharovorans]|nr:hypothetical protein CHELA40_14586 [Chelatococcus asaccharovorans]
MGNRDPQGRERPGSGQEPIVSLMMAGLASRIQRGDRISHSTLRGVVPQARRASQSMTSDTPSKVHSGGLSLRG